MEFDCRNLEPHENYKLLISLVLPRPIALVTTIDEHGRVNAAPFSFFNAMGFNPPIVALGIEARADLSHKDTAANIGRSAEFVINIVDEPLAQRMNICAIDFPPEVDETAKAGLRTLPSVSVNPPRIADAPASVECERIVTLEIHDARHIVIGEIVRMHVRDEAVDPASLRVDLDRLGPVGRLMGPGYVRITDRFDMPRLSLEDWNERNSS